MTMVPRGGALGLDDVTIARLEAEAAKDRRLIERVDAATEAAIKRELDAVPTKRAPTAERDGRKLGTITERAMMAAFVVFADKVGGPDFPQSRYGLQKMIADTASELGITEANEPLKHGSGNLKQVAAAAMRAAQLMKARDDKG